MTPDHDRLLAWLAARAVRGVEEVDGIRYTRVLRAGTVVGVELTGVPVGACPFELVPVLGLDVPADAVPHVLSASPELPRTLAGVQVPGGLDPAEVLVRAILGQQVSVAAARTFGDRLVNAVHGSAAASPQHPFPTPAQIASADLDGIGLTAARAAALRHAASALVDGSLVLDGDARAELLALPGIGPWTVEYVMLRGLRDLDAIPASDLVLLARSRELGYGDSPAQLLRYAERWRPYRGVAAQLLWSLEG